MDIVGRITQDAQVREVKNGSKVVSFSIAMNDSYRNKEGERVQLTSYVDCSYWNRTGIAGHLTKGLLVELSGRISPRAWIGSDGKPHGGLDFNTQTIKFLGGSAKNQGQATDKAPAKKSGRKTDKAEGEKDDLPF